MGTLAHATPATDTVSCAICRVVCALAGLLRLGFLYVLFACLLSLLVSPRAHAALTPTPGFSCFAVSFLGWGTFTSSTKLACAEQVTAHGKGTGTIHPAMVTACTTGNECGWGWDISGALNNPTIRANEVSTCPANSSGTTSCTCNAGFTEYGGACVASSPDCPIGQGRTFNRTEGWGRSPNPNADDLVVSYGGPASVYDYNDGVCIGNIAKVEKCWRSQEPSAQGLYRTSCDYTMVISGVAPPSTGDSAANPETPIPACPGTLGTVNGKPMCVGTASNPLPSPQPAPNQPTGAGNPSAGVKPSTGPGSGSTGSGRTPSNGNGGNDGGPASSAIGRGGSGQRAEVSETGENTGAVCGAPPLPACNVKVDETGTPDGASLKDTSQMDSVWASREAGLGTARDSAGDASWGIVPSWIVDRPCEPWNVATLPEMIGGGAVTLDLCPFKPISDGILNFVWVCYGIFAVTGLVASAMTGRET